MEQFARKQSPGPGFLSILVSARHKRKIPSTVELWYTHTSSILPCLNTQLPPRMERQEALWMVFCTLERYSWPCFISGSVPYQAIRNAAVYCPNRANNFHWHRGTALCSQLHPQTPLAGSASQHCAVRAKTEHEARDSWQESVPHPTNNAGPKGQAVT